MGITAKLGTGQVATGGGAVSRWGKIASGLRNGCFVVGVGGGWWQYVLILEIRVWKPFVRFCKMPMLKEACYFVVSDFKNLYNDHGGIFGFGYFYGKQKLRDIIAVAWWQRKAAATAPRQMHTRTWYVPGAKQVISFLTRMYVAKAGWSTLTKLIEMPCVS